MRTFLSSVLWALLLRCCCQTAQAEVFTSISRFKCRFHRITREGFWSQTSISGGKKRPFNDNVTTICHFNVLTTTFTYIHKISLECISKFLSLNQQKKVFDTQKLPCCTLLIHEIQYRLFICFYNGFMPKEKDKFKMPFLWHFK